MSDYGYEQSGGCFVQGLKAVAAVGSVALSLVAIHIHNTYDPQKQQFEITEKITEADKDSLTGTVVQINETHGKATKKFTLGDNVQIFSHDEHDISGFVTDIEGSASTPQEVSIGNCVRFSGHMILGGPKRIKYLPAFRAAQEVECPLK